MFTSCVLLTSGNFFSQLVCVPYEWRLTIVIIVVLNAIVCVLMEVRNSGGKNACLLSGGVFFQATCLSFV